MAAYDMRYYIDRQPDAMREALASRKETSAPFVDLWRAAGADRLYLVGSGTSGNAARAAAPYLEEVLRLEVTAISPTSLPSAVRGKPFFLFISQGGQSTNTVKAIERLAAWPHLALTGEIECRINSLCPHVVLTCGHEEAGPKTMGYTSTILTLYLMALEAAEAIGVLPRDAYDSTVRLLQETADRMLENIALCWQWVREQAADLAAVPHWAVAGADVGRFVAGEAALKLMETLLRPATGFEFEEYLHGPTMMLSADMGGMYLLPPAESPDRPRMEALADLHETFGSRVITVCAGKQAERTGSRLTLAAPEDTFLAPFWQILPSQVMGASLPELLGLAGRGHAIFKRIDEAVGVKCKEKK